MTQMTRGAPSISAASVTAAMLTTTAAPSRQNQGVSVAFAGAGTRYLGAGGFDNSGTTTQALARTPRADAGTVKGASLRFMVGANDMIGGNTFVITLQKNGVNTALNVSVANTDVAGTKVSGTGGDITYVAGDDLSWEVVSNSANEPEGYLTWEELGS